FRLAVVLLCLQQQLFDILEQRLRLDGALIGEHLFIRGYFTDSQGEVRNGEFYTVSTERTDHSGKLHETRTTPGGDLRKRASALEHIPERPPRQCRLRLQRGDSRRADTSPRHVQNSSNADGVQRIVDDTQIGEHVLDLIALVESHAADNLIGHAPVYEHVFE